MCDHLLPASAKSEGWWEWSQVTLSAAAAAHNRINQSYVACTAAAAAACLSR